MTRERKKKCKLSGDVISNLPGDVIDNILTRLPLHEAGRTCILSRRWRYMWVNLSCVVFDRDTFAGGSTKKLLIAIQEVMLLKRVPIVKFVLSLPELKISRHIDALISLGTRNYGLQELTLHFWQGDKLYKLPPALFSCLQLTHLSLQHCVIEPPIWFKGFNQLVSLEISECSILPDILLGLISSCLLLEELKVSSPNPIEVPIEISAPNLRKLSLKGDFPLIRVRDAPLLSSCVMCLPGGVVEEGVVETVKVTSVFFESICNLPAVQDLQLDFYYAGVNSVSMPRKLTTTLIHLRSLTLWNISFDFLHEVSSILCLIRSSPNLVKIVVSAYKPTKNSENVKELLQVQEWQGVFFNSLREVEFNRIYGTTHELEFLELLLTLSPKLETLIVTPYPKVELKDRFEILTKVTHLRRSSTLARVVYRNN